jgi:hypothetical protein
MAAEAARRNRALHLTGAARWLPPPALAAHAPVSPPPMGDPLPRGQPRLRPHPLRGYSRVEAPRVRAAQNND